MIYSMTGFGRSELQNEQHKFTVEVKSVNHRYLEPSIRCPRRLSSFENNIRNIVKEYACRGKIDISVSFEDYTCSNLHLKYNEELASRYAEYAAEIEKKFLLPNDLTVSKLMACPEVLTMEEEPSDDTELWEELEKTLRDALEKFRQSRNTEGMHLQQDLLGKLDHMEENLNRLIRRAPGILEDYKARLREKTRELLEDAQVDESRIAAEVVLFADKICTDEETVRLQSHINNMRTELKRGGGVGRKLDFLAQEMNREANTILSKSNDKDTTELAVELKTEIEKIREQIQNIE
ncbi:YicC/YloC family endoribonuclease [Bilifractor porci]|uniref:YicC family protein n=1 Tax=Bilifractor porci TaxID=2606636 RepID=A0A7X2P614_9FIRM|nr:YicC/YloC family endoribonuclease [Bilifractor porci]MST80882.1 YicC family protein [Bilifractor porci]